MKAIDNSTIVICSPSPLPSSPRIDGEDAIAQLNALVIKLGQIFGKMRDLLRQYNQIQQLNGFNIVNGSVADRLNSIKLEFDSKKGQAIAQIVGGVIELGGGVLNCASETFSGSTSAGQGLSSATQGIATIFTNESNSESRVMQVNSEYADKLAQLYSKNAGDSQERANQTSRDMREALAALIQLHERLCNSVHM
ncbi:type III secretion protein [Salmonella enterica]|nr:type III secretion protein [Salmonella enterica subsp. enterica serovar Sandiego]EEC0251687.1 type III secretion protein [Salmonella enterica subsp. enterica]EJW2129028.1 type III secretion protein [Salmonella enterica]EEE4266511.1 type III secretion protein [Salmonella enterica subsp. enterica serovar Sandiego]EKT1704960.1 type III secretion protein [Salmonella enterica]